MFYIPILIASFVNQLFTTSTVTVYLPAFLPGN